MSVRPQKRAPLKIASDVTVLETGLQGEHYAGRHLPERLPERPERSITTARANSYKV